LPAAEDNAAANWPTEESIGGQLLQRRANCGVEIVRHGTSLRDERLGMT